MSGRRRVILAILLVGWAAVVAACGGPEGTKKGGGGQEGEATSEPAGRIEIEVLKVRLEPFRSPAGFDTKMVYVDWKNTGDRPVKMVHATIKVYDHTGDLSHSVPDYPIYGVFDDRPGIVPGETYIEPAAEGHVLFKTPGQIPTRAEVEITGVDDRGIEIDPRPGTKREVRRPDRSNRYRPVSSKTAPKKEEPKPAPPPEDPTPARKAAYVKIVAALDAVEAGAVKKFGRKPKEDDKAGFTIPYRVFVEQETKKALKRLATELGLSESQIAAIKAEGDKAGWPRK